MAENHVLLETIELTQSATSVTFDNLPTSGYTDLKIVVSARGAQSATSHALTMRLNGATTGYSTKELVGDGASVGSATRTALGSAMYVANICGNNATANTFGNTEILIPNYRSSNAKTISVSAASENNATEAYITFITGYWSATSPVTSIELIGLAAHGSLLAGSTFSLYGVAAVGTTPAVAPLATGGNIVANDGTYWYHAFLSSGTFTPQTALTCDVLQIAGGGGGGYLANNGFMGGGGAGGLLNYLNQNLITATNYNVTVGSGGSLNTPGSNSQFNNLTASIGGGRGAATNLQNAGNGGSGGGGGENTYTAAGTGTSGQGNNGGVGVGGSTGGGGGGGGAGAVGSAAVTGVGGGAGGAGVNTYSSWGAATLTGQNISGTHWYAGGGGGTADAATPGAGGSGGGGIGADYNTSAGGNGLAGTGGGGGGGGGNQTGGNGGSGVIVIRYAMV